MYTHHPLTASVISTFLHMTKNLEMTLAASGCDQCVRPVDVVTGCIQSVVDLLDYLIMKYPYSFISVLFSTSSLLSIQF